MKNTKTALLIFILTVIVFACTPATKEMTLDDYAKIDIEITATDMKPESINEVAKKYGYTVEQYQQFSEKVTAEPELQEKLGEIRLDEQKNR